MSDIKTDVLLNAVGLAMKLLPEDAGKRLADSIIDEIEDVYEGTETEWDDFFIGGICQTVRTAFNIPDYPDS